MDTHVAASRPGSALQRPGHRCALRHCGPTARHAAATTAITRNHRHFVPCLWARRGSSSSSSSRTQQLRPLLCPASIREFISSECPLPGVDGRWREQPRDATLTTLLLEAPADSPPCPGQRRLLRLTGPQLDTVIQEQGQLVLALMQSPGVVAVPRRGSCACRAQVVGLQRLAAGGALVRVVVQQRVAVQALSTQQEPLRCTAAPLPDRWAYFTRCDALQLHEATLQTTAGACDVSPSAAAASSSSSRAGGGAPPASPSPPEVVRAWHQVQDAAACVQELLASLADTVTRVTSEGDLSDERAGAAVQVLQQQEVADELEHLLAWALQEQAPAPQQQESSSQATTPAPPAATNPGCVSLDQAVRLSFAPLAASGLAAALAELHPHSSSSSSSSPSDRWVSGGMECSDLGNRLEEALEVLEEARATLGAVLALQG